MYLILIELIDFNSLSYLILGSIVLIATLIVVSAKNPIHRIAALIVVFTAGAFIFMLLDFYFLGLTYIIVYVGAIAILFLFVIMMVHIPSGNGTPIFRDDFIISNSYASSSDETWTPSIPRLEPMDDYLLYGITTSTYFFGYHNIPIVDKSAAKKALDLEQKYLTKYFLIQMELWEKNVFGHPLFIDELLKYDEELKKLQMIVNSPKRPLIVPTNVPFKRNDEYPYGYYLWEGNIVTQCYNNIDCSCGAYSSYLDGSCCHYDINGNLKVQPGNGGNKDDKGGLGGNGGLGGGGNNEYVSINPSVQASIMGDINPIFFLYYKSMGVAIIVVIFLIFIIFLPINLALYSHLPIDIYSYFYPIWSIEYKTITDIESLAIIVYVAYPTALILISIALWTVMIGIISICSSNGPTGSSTGASSADLACCHYDINGNLKVQPGNGGNKDDKGGNDSPSGKGGFGVLPNFYPNDLDFFGISYIDLGQYGYLLAMLLFVGAIIAYVFQGFFSFESKKNQAGNLIMLIISLELILLSIGILFINISVGLDDLVGVNLTLFLLPLAGAESAIALALLVAYYPLRGDISLNLMINTWI